MLVDRADRGRARRIDREVAGLRADANLLRVRDSLARELRNCALSRGSPGLHAGELRAFAVVGRVGADARGVAELRERMREKPVRPHVAKTAPERLALRDSVAVCLLGGRNVAAAEHQHDLTLRELPDGVAADIEAPHRVVAEHSIARMAPGKAVERVPVLERGVGAHHDTAVAAELVRRAVVVLRYREGLPEDARRRLHHRLVVRRVAALDVGRLVDVERQFLVAGLRMVAVAMVVDYLKRFALVGLRRVVPPVASRDESMNAGVLQALCHADVCLGLDLVKEFRELLLLADVLGGVLGIALPLRPFVVLLDVHVGRTPPDRRYRVLVHQRDEEHRGIVLPLDAGVGVYVVEDLHRAAEPLVLGRLVDRHYGLDRIRVKRLVEALAAAEAAHRVEVERRVDARLLALGEQVVELVELGG